MKYTKHELQKRAYEIYQLDWMIGNGFSLRNLLDVLKEGAVEMAIDGTLDYDMNQAFSQMEDYYWEHGFNGMVYCCFEEFIDAEYTDVEFMERILPEDMYCDYLKYRILELDDKLKQKGR